jgi:putative tryptophan/tyrosine transport system substrate-binding protein
MERRELIAGIGSVAIAWPLAAGAQQPAGRVYPVGYLSTSSREQARADEVIE